MSENEVQNLILENLRVINTKVDKIQVDLSCVTQSQKDCKENCLPRVTNLEEDIGDRSTGLLSRVKELETKILVVSVIVGLIIAAFLPVAFDKYFKHDTEQNKEQHQNHYDLNAVQDKNNKVYKVNG